MFIHCDIPLPEGNIIPLKFLTSKTTSPLRTSPLLYDRLGKAISNLKKDNSLCRVAILDDGTLSGKMFRELEQLAFCLGATDVDTIAIVDRGGLPIHLDYIERYLKNHHRFWRWDVPPLGHRRGCPLCAALAQVSAMRKRLYSRSMSHRLKHWIEIWKPVEVVDHWETHGLKPIPLGKDQECDSHCFGIYPNEPEPAVHIIHHKTSTGMAAAIMEITRSITCPYYALEKARKMVEYYGPEIGIEILSAQLLLFIDELNYWDKVDLFNDLLQYLWKCQEDSAATALAGLCVTLIDDDIVTELWPIFKRDLLCEKIVPILDARIAADYLRTRFNGLPNIVADCCSENPSIAERYNYLIIFSDSSFRQNIARIFEIIGESYSKIHNMGLLACLNEITDAVATNDHQRAERRLKEVRRILESLVEALQGLERQLYIQDIKQPLTPKTDLEFLNRFLNNIPCVKDSLESLNDWTTKVKADLLDENNRNSFAYRYRSQFVRIPPMNAAISAFLSELVTRVSGEEWTKLVTDRLANNKSLADRWGDKSTKKATDTKPIIEGANRKSWPKEVHIYFDCYVEHCLYEILTNCLHVNEDIANPWIPKRNSQALEVKATMWWCLYIEERFVEIEFLNACDRNEIFLNPTEALSGLERVGGEVLCFVVEKHFDKISPISNRYSLPVESLREYLGLSNGQRIAITIVRIPMMKTIQER